MDAAIGALDRDGINKVALVAFERNELGNTFWEHVGFERRTDCGQNTGSIRTY